MVQYSNTLGRLSGSRGGLGECKHVSCELVSYS